MTTTTNGKTTKGNILKQLTDALDAVTVARDNFIPADLTADTRSDAATTIAKLRGKVRAMQYAIKTMGTSKPAKAKPAKATKAPKPAKAPKAAKAEKAPAKDAALNSR